MQYSRREVSRRSSTRSQVPFSLSFFLLAVLHAVVYSLLVCESPAQAFLVREQANFEGFASLNSAHLQSELISAALAGSIVLYATLAYTQRAKEAEAEQAARTTALDSHTQPPSLASLAGSVSGTHFLGVFAFIPSSDKAAAAAADNQGAATIVAASA